MDQALASRSGTLWFLAGQLDEGVSARFVPVHTSPFTVGRRGDMALCLPRRTVSSVHAELFEQGGNLIIRDLDSTNGTYVNAQRISQATAVHEDDLIQFADVPFRVKRQSGRSDTHTVQENVVDRALALVQFDKLMSDRAVTPFYQPIVDLHTGAIVGHEVLGRSRLFGLESPMAMFRAAAHLNLEVELSRMFRWEGIREAMHAPGLSHLFVNTHPIELVKPGLLESLKSLRDVNADHPITLEIHEAAVTDLNMMRRLRESLRDLRINLAYDDFGAGQTRLVELVEVRPDYLKFDMTLVQGLDRLSEQRQQMVGTLVRMARDLQIVPLAEGIETPGEHQVCKDIGFQLGQGFLFGRPAPVNATPAPPISG